MPKVIYISHIFSVISNLYAWGYQQFGILGNGQDDISPGASPSSPVMIGTINVWAKIASKYEHTMAIRTDGTLWAWGRNVSGCFGDGTTTNQSSPVQIGLAIWSAIANGQFSTLAIKSDGTLWSWGRGSEGQLGHGNTTTLSSPVQIGTNADWIFCACGLFNSFGIRGSGGAGTLWAWGNNPLGALGDGTTVGKSSPVQIGTRSDWAQADGQGTYTLYLRSGGTVWQTGFGTVSTAVLGSSSGSDAHSSPVQVVGITNGIKISASGGAAACLKSDGNISTWGNNGQGELGNGTATNCTNLSTLTVLGSAFYSDVGVGGADGEGHMLAVGDGKLWAWGQGNNGQLGDGTGASKSSPVQIGTLTDWIIVDAGFESSFGIRNLP